MRKRENDRTIHAIKSDSGTTVTSHNDINNTFRQFYEKLYTSQAHAPPEVMKQFLHSCKLPKLAEKDWGSLETEITCEKIKKTINGKSPEADGICNEFHKKFSNLIVPHLLKMYKKAFEVGMLPPTLN